MQRIFLVAKREEGMRGKEEESICYHQNLKWDDDLSWRWISFDTVSFREKHTWGSKLFFPLIRCDVFASFHFFLHPMWSSSSLHMNLWLDLLIFMTLFLPKRSVKSCWMGLGFLVSLPITSGISSWNNIVMRDVSYSQDVHSWQRFPAEEMLWFPTGLSLLSSFPILFDVTH